MSKNGSHLFTRNQDFVIVLLRLKNNLSNRFPVVSFLKRERFVPQRSLFLLGQQPAQYSAVMVATLIQLWFPFRIPPTLAFLGNYPFSNMKNPWWKGESIQIKMLLLKWMLLNNQQTGAALHDVHKPQRRRWKLTIACPEKWRFFIFASTYFTN